METCKIFGGLTVLKCQCSAKRPVSATKTIFLTSIAILLLSEVVTSSCRRKMAAETITYQDCLPKRLLTFVCVGTCTSYARVSPTNPSVVERTCFQCREAVMERRHVVVMCPEQSDDSRRRFKRVRIPVSVPQSCMCESCDVSIDVLDTVRRNHTDLASDGARGRNLK